MKVDDYLSVVEVPEFDYQAVVSLIDRRETTFRGFASIEERKGFVKPSVSFSTSQGQEMLRILLFRVLEEVTEASNARSKLHVQEELIDAVNYFFSALMLDESHFPKRKISEMLYYVIDSQLWYGGTTDSFTLAPIQDDGLGRLCKLIAGDLAETFRNRSWMNNTQQTYFHGHDVIQQVFEMFMKYVLSRFANWSDFYRLYVAKDMVLQFRLKSNY